MPAGSAMRSVAARGEAEDEQEEQRGREADLLAGRSRLSGSKDPADSPERAAAAQRPLIHSEGLRRLRPLHLASSVQHLPLAAARLGPSLTRRALLRIAPEHAPTRRPLPVTAVKLNFDRIPGQTQHFARAEIQLQPRTCMLLPSHVANPR
eukprot:251997-Rhodomonas_salina.3